jgi:molecular chaperone GrpE
MSKKKEEAKQEATPGEQKKEEQKEMIPDNVKELTDTLQHLQAEFENYKKRVERDNLDFIKCANEDAILKILPIIDNFELALKSARVKDDFYRGMELIYSQLIDALHSQGLRAIECQGKKFDPYYHEVLLAEECEKEQNTVMEELQKGYLLHDKVIRHSKVKIAKKRKEERKEEMKQDEVKKGVDNEDISPAGA